MSSGSGSARKGFRPRRRPGQNYRPVRGAQSKVKGPKEPYDVSKHIPKIDMSKIKVTDLGDQEDDDALMGIGALHPQLNIALQMAQREDLDVETQLKMMDYFLSEEGSTEDLVGERRIMALETLAEEDRDQILAEMQALVDQESLDYMELPESEHMTMEDLKKSETGGTSKIPANQLAHGDW